MLTFIWRIEEIIRECKKRSLITKKFLKSGKDIEYFINNLDWITFGGEIKTKFSTGKIQNKNQSMAGNLEEEKNNLKKIEKKIRMTPDSTKENFTEKEKLNFFKLVKNFRNLIWFASFWNIVSHFLQKRNYWKSFTWTNEFPNKTKSIFIYVSWF